MFARDIEVKNPVGLNARPATAFIRLANKFESAVWIEAGENKANAKSFLGVLSLNVTKGKTVRISADGPDEKDAVYSLIDLVASDFSAEMSS
jgi:phosphocarrier protein